MKTYLSFLAKGTPKLISISFEVQSRKSKKKKFFLGAKQTFGGKKNIYTNYILKGKIYRKIEHILIFISRIHLYCKDQTTNNKKKYNQKQKTFVC